MRWIGNLTIACICLMASVTAFARPMIADLAVREIDIDHNFTGLDILLFGAREDVGTIVVVVRGPEREYVVRKKEKIGGIWVNRHSVTFEDANSFYAIAASQPLDTIRNDTLLKALGIGVETQDFSVTEEQSGITAFQNALIEYKQKASLYTQSVEEVSFWGETLFRTVLTFPKNIIRGTYTAEIYLFNDGQLVAMQSTPIEVKKVGFEAFVFDLAHESRFIYGILCVLMALTAGWSFSTVFGRR